MSRLTEEIRRLSRKLDNLDQRLEKVEETNISSNVPKFTAPETPQEPKFKKGEWVRSMVTGTVGQIESGYGFKNHFNDNWNVYVVSIDGNHFTSRENLLEPYFPKEGEYMYVQTSVSDVSFIAVFSHRDATRIYDKCSITIEHSICFSSDTEPLICIDTIGELRPASVEEKKLLDLKLAERGLKFDGENVVKDNTPKVGDFCIFWDEPEDSVCDILHTIEDDNDYPFSRNDFWYKHCIKFESEEQFRRIKEGKK